MYKSFTAKYHIELLCSVYSNSCCKKGCRIKVTQQERYVESPMVRLVGKFKQRVHAGLEQQN